MAPDGSTAPWTVGFGADDFGAGWRSFFAAFPALRLAPAPLATFFRATVFVALLLVLFLAMRRLLFRCALRDHIAHRRLLSATSASDVGQETARPDVAPTRPL